MTCNARLNRMERQRAISLWSASATLRSDNGRLVNQRIPVDQEMEQCSTRFLLKVCEQRADHGRLRRSLLFAGPHLGPGAGARDGLVGAYGHRRDALWT